MIYFFYSFLIIILLLNYILKRKYEKILSLLTILLIFILCVFVKDTYTDWEAYSTVYYNSTISFFDKDIGFGLLCYVLANLGLPALSLRFIIFLIGFIFIFKGLNIFKINKITFLCLYSVYPLTSDSIQLRNFLVVSFLFYGTSLLYRNKDNDKYKFVFLIGIASLFHKIAIFYLPIIFLKFINSSNSSSFLKRLLVIFGVLIILVGWNPALIRWITDYLMNLSNDINFGNIKNIISQVQSGWLIDWTIQIINIAILFSLMKDLKKRKLINLSETKIIEFIFWINIYAIIFLPFCLISFDYFRLIRNLLPLNYVAYCCYLKTFQNRSYVYISLKKIVFFLISIFLVVSFNYIKIGYRGDIINYEFYAFFDNNLISQGICDIFH